MKQVVRTQKVLGTVFRFISIGLSLQSRINSMLIRIRIFSGSRDENVKLRVSTPQLHRFLGEDSDLFHSERWKMSAEPTTPPDLNK